MSKLTAIPVHKAKALILLCMEIQTLNIECSDEKSILLMQLPTPISQFVAENIPDLCIDKYDVDFDLIDELFKPTQVCSNPMLLFKPAFVKELTKERHAYVMLNLQSLKDLLTEQFEQSANEPSSSQSTALAIVTQSESKTGELLPASNSNHSSDLLDDMMFNQIMSAVGSNLMVSMALMEKKAQGKLNKGVLNQIISLMPDGYMMRGPWGGMMVMNILNSL